MHQWMRRRTSEYAEEALTCDHHGKQHIQYADEGAIRSASITSFHQHATQLHFFHQESPVFPSRCKGFVSFLQRACGGAELTWRGERQGEPVGVTMRWPRHSRSQQSSQSRGSPVGSACATRRLEGSTTGTARATSPLTLMNSPQRLALLPLPLVAHSRNPLLLALAWPSHSASFVPFSADGSRPFLLSYGTFAQLRSAALAPSGHTYAARR